ncbi:MAG: hypothetical protein DCF21_16620 [Leptolyngbya sp.]|nr:MAG: hypothetical protein DCF21_16620 [Leptolyngbya sp.]
MFQRGFGFLGTMYRWSQMTETMIEALFFYVIESMLISVKTIRTGLLILLGFWALSTRKH